ncbi:MAG: type III-B CRISPR module-associated protein Cmr5 [Candidatus Hodarchaeales archaeon]
MSGRRTTTLEQRRALDALNIVEKISVYQERGKFKKFRSFVERFPSNLVSNGLGQSIAMELAAARMGEKNRGDEEKTHEEVYMTISEWLKKIDLLPGDKELIKWISEIDQRDYIRAQAEILSYMGWLKKFCQAKLSKE